MRRMPYGIILDNPGRKQIMDRILLAGEQPDAMLEVQGPAAY